MSDYSQTHCAIYLRGSAQTVERQRQGIQRALIKPLGITQVTEYAEAESGRSPDRPAYHALLSDVALGRIQMILVASPDSLGHDVLESAHSLQELLAHKVEIRFASLPDAVITQLEQRFILWMQFIFAETESLRTGQRTKGGLAIKMQNGGFVGKAPDGYLNKQRQRQAGEEHLSGPVQRWVEPDPKRWHIWREAWDLLLSDSYTLEGICHILHERGYTFASGRPFVEHRPNKKPRCAKNALSRIFHNWFYAGWVVSKQANIPPKQVRGSWKPLVSTEEFERGLAILAQRIAHRQPKVRHSYLLSGLLYVRHENKTQRMIAMTPNSQRSGGGTRYYADRDRGIYVRCEVVHKELERLLQQLHVDAEVLPLLREAYQAYVRRDKNDPQQEQRRIQQALKQTYKEEERLAALYARGTISQAIWDKHWQDWQLRRLELNRQLTLLEQSDQQTLDNLDEAAQILTRLPSLYGILSAEDQKRLLKGIIQRIVIDIEGTIMAMQLHPPFAYLHQTAEEVKKHLGRVNAAASIVLLWADAGLDTWGISSTVVSLGSHKPSSNSPYVT